MSLILKSTTHIESTSAKEFKIEQTPYFEPFFQPTPAKTTRIGVGRHALPRGVREWPSLMTNPPYTPASSADLAKAWSSGLVKGGNQGYQMKSSIICDPNAPKYVPGAGGVAGHVMGKKRW